MTKAERKEARRTSLAKCGESKQCCWPITHLAHPAIRAGKDQCIDSPKFGHHQPCNNPARFTHPAPTFKHCCYVADGRTYSVDKLLMTPEELQAPCQSPSPVPPTVVKYKRNETAPRFIGLQANRLR
ncbi:hypothetical protein DFH28DRAFT_1131366 [Melampsora americana]|nr:hypothetical protein DFH28DRAFT_1131366 [Melampsora americana]